MWGQYTEEKQHVQTYIFLMIRIPDRRKRQIYWPNSQMNTCLLPQACWLVEYTETHTYIPLADIYIHLFSGKEVI